MQRLLLSIAWKLFPYARAQIKTARRVRVPLRARGDFAALEEIFVLRAYEPLLAKLPGPIVSWVDLGCNAGLFSAYLYDRACEAGRGTECRALLVDPGSCVETAREFVRLNGLNFDVVQACIGDGQPTVFYESKSSTRSSSSIKPNSREKEIRVETVSVTTLLEQHHFGTANLLKVDIEGAEKYLLNEPGLFRRFRAGILEWHAETTTGPTAAKWITDQGGRIVHVVSQDGTEGDPLASHVGMIAWVTDAA